MNKLTQIIGNGANVADGTFSPKLNAGAVRKPRHCPECQGTGGHMEADPEDGVVVFIYCEACHGTGGRPEAGGTVRKPYECIACDGDGVIRGFATLDPSARRREVDCLRCGGTGQEPETEEEE